MEKLERRKKNKKRGKKRARDDLEEDSDAEEARLQLLGAWIECGVWYVSPRSESQKDPSNPRVLANIFPIS